MSSGELDAGDLPPENSDAPLPPQSSFQGHQTARRAAQILTESDPRFCVPSRPERDALVVAFAMRRRTLPVAAFDAVRVDRAINLSDAAAIAADIDQIIVYEIKSTNRVGLADDLSRYFFNVTAAELLAAQSLGKHYRFAFVNTLTGSVQEMSLQEVLAKAKAFYPAWHIRF